MSTMPTGVTEEELVAMLKRATGHTCNCLPSTIDALEGIRRDVKQLISDRAYLGEAVRYYQRLAIRHEERSEGLSERLEAAKAREGALKKQLEERAATKRTREKMSGGELCG